MEVLGLYLYISFKQLGKYLILTVKNNYDDNIRVNAVHEEYIDVHMITPFDVAPHVARITMGQLGTGTYRGVSFLN